MVIATDIQPSPRAPSTGPVAVSFNNLTEYGRHLHLRANKRLSPRERQVLELVGWGLTAPAMARQLKLQTRTIDLHCWKIKRKLGLDTHSDLARFAQIWVSLDQRGHKLGGDPEGSVGLKKNLIDITDR